VKKAKLEEEVALYKGICLLSSMFLSTMHWLEKVDEAFGMVAKLLANQAIVNGMSFLGIYCLVAAF